MPLPVWPDINYLHELGSVKIQVTDGSSKVFTDMDTGPKRARRRFSSSPSRLDLSLDLTDDETELFKKFYKEILLDGSLYFTMPIFSGSVYSDHIVRILPSTVPEITGIGFRRNNLGLNIEIRSLYIVSDAGIWLGENFGYDLSLKLEDRLKYAVNVLWPEIFL